MSREMQAPAESAPNVRAGNESDRDLDETPRKRRRLSHEEDSSVRPARDGVRSHDIEIASAVQAPQIRPAVQSRIRPKQNGLKASQRPNQAPVLEATEINSGKIVDARSSFATLDVQPWLIAALGAMAIYRPTAIQKGCIPPLLAGKDVIGGSKTGSGKTIAFVVPILQKWAEDSMGVFAVVLTPTRELALQILEQFQALSALQDLRAVLITGGTDMRPQALALANRPHVVIATPGRLADHISTSGQDTVASLRRTRMVVLDEADRLLKAGPGSMLPDVETCLNALPSSQLRQTCLFTATLTPEVMTLKERPRAPGAREVVVCEVDIEAELAVPASLQQTYLQVPVTYREAYLHVLLQTARHAAMKAIIVFCNRTATADLLERLLHGLSHAVTSLHSRLPQAQRNANLARFRAHEARILIATDVASRGLDIPAVELVVNYDVPRDPDDYVHRVGRTARAGREGASVTLVGQRDVQLILGIEARVGGAPMVEYAEEGVNIETRVVRDALKPVGEKKREVLLDMEDGRDVKGRRIRGR